MLNGTALDPRISEISETTRDGRAHSQASGRGERAGSRRGLGFAQPWPRANTGTRIHTAVAHASKEAPLISTDDVVSKKHDTEKTDAVENKEKWGWGCFFGL